jgi:hypothetical protein
MQDLTLATVPNRRIREMTWSINFGGLRTHLTAGMLPSSEDSMSFAVSGECSQTRLQDYTALSA